MITIKFPDPDTELEALGFLLGRFPGRALKTGEVLVPDAALQALALEGYQFTVIGKSTYEQQIASLRDIVPATFKRQCPRRVQEWGNRPQASTVAKRGIAGSSAPHAD